MPIDGFTEPGFEQVRDAFAKNFEAGREIGAAFCAYHRGRPVVDLWGGETNVRTHAPWERDTMVVVFSTTKGAAAVCANKLAQENRLDVTAPVVEYWPDFGTAGKTGITVEQLLSHQAGLAWVDAPLTLDEALAWEPMIHALEDQAPAWEPGTAHGYHAVTFGYLVGEVVRRVTGRTIGTYFRDEVARPLGLDFWIGLPEQHEARVARLYGGILGEASTSPGEEARSSMADVLGPDSMTVKALSAGGSFSGDGIFNTRAMHAAEVPAAAGIADARSVARMYAACIGDVDGVRLLTDAQLRDATTQRTSGPNIVLMDLDLQFGLGFILPSSLIQLGGPRSFGHFGAGGSAGWADPDAQLAFGYVMNRMELGLAGDQRSYTLVNACYDALA
ncbi:MAG TPA: serine hydrolase domain-containing protein [Acidimicrobiia bacterium]|nr:serine hydrolase domain-containing protein [Acidimicrobiia bacterium]